MEVFSVSLLVGLLLSLCLRSSFALPQGRFAQHAPLRRPQVIGYPGQTAAELPKAPAEQQVQVNTVTVICHPDSLEVVIKADMFGIGVPVHRNELRLGVEPNDFCIADVSSSQDEYRIVASLMDCGTKHWMTEDSLVYTNLLVYSPSASPDGLIRMEEAVIPLECHYKRKYGVSSSSLTPTWSPFKSTLAAEETLAFDFRIMSYDWLSEMGSRAFHLGEPIGIEASVSIRHHTALRVFVSSCVATLEPDVQSEPKYVIIEDGCLLDSALPGSRALFYPRAQDDKLQFVFDAFKFHNVDRGQLYITCHLTAVPVHDTKASNKACTFSNGRWRSADGNDYLCGYCRNPNEAVKTPSKSVGPRGFGRVPVPKSFKKSPQTEVWEQEAKLGPVQILPARESGPVPLDELPPLSTGSSPAMYGSQWRSGVNSDQSTGLPSGPTTPEAEDQTSKEDKNFTTGSDVKDTDAVTEDATETVTEDAPHTGAEDISPLEDTARSDNEGAATLSESSPTEVTNTTNATATESDLSA